jgi:hypothetical protein
MASASASTSPSIAAAAPLAVTRQSSQLAHALEYGESRRERSPGGARTNKTAPNYDAASAAIAAAERANELAAPAESEPERVFSSPASARRFVVSQALANLRAARAAMSPLNRLFAETPINREAQQEPEEDIMSEREAKMLFATIEKLRPTQMSKKLLPQIASSHFPSILLPYCCKLRQRRRIASRRSSAKGSPNLLAHRRPLSFLPSPSPLILVSATSPPSSSSSSNHAFTSSRAR